MSAPAGRLVARIGKPHGLHGEVTVQTHTSDPETRFVEGAVFSTQAAAGSGVPRRLTVASARLHRTIWLLGFAEIPDRTGAESLRGTQLLLVDPPPGVFAPSAPALEEGAEDAFYEEDLVGLAAVDPHGVAIGTVSGLEIGAAQDRLEVTLPDGRRAQVPFVSAIVPVVDLPAGRVVVDAPAGLLDLAE